MHKISFKHSLASKLLLAILALPVLLTLVGFFVFHQIEQRRLVEFSRLKMKHQSDVNTDLLVNKLEVFREKALRLASDNQIIVPYKLRVPFQLSKHLDQLLDQNELKSITIISADGQSVIAAGEPITNFKFDIKQLSTEMQRYRTRSFYTVRHDGALGKRLAAAAYAPVLSGTHMIAHIFISGDVILTEAFSDTALISDGKIQSQSSELPFLRPLIRKIDSQAQFGQHSFTDLPVLISKIQIPGYPDPDTYLVCATDQRNVFSKNRQFFISGMIISGCILILLAAYALYLSQRLTDPLFHIVRVADRIIAKDEDVKWLPERKDEIGALNNSLRLMTQTLQNTITELKIAKQQAEEGHQAKLANKAKSEFLANMSHELRTPLNHIIGFTELVVDQHFGDLNNTQEEYLQDALASGRHLLSLINDILDLSKVEAGKEELQLSAADLRTLLTNSMVMIKEKCHNHGIRTHISLDGIPEVLQVDERKIKQVVYNLLSNAAKFTPEQGSINLTASLVSKRHLADRIPDKCRTDRISQSKENPASSSREGDHGSTNPDIGSQAAASAGQINGETHEYRAVTGQTDQLETASAEQADRLHACGQLDPSPLSYQRIRRTVDNYVQVSITDSGIGIAAEDMERIFNTFEQVESTSNRKFQGTGLGLSLSKRYIELHGGAIWAESDGPNKGACFSFIIPALT